MLYLKDKREIMLFEITEIKEIEIERAFKNILKKYDDVVFKGVYNIRNCWTIKYAIRLLDKTLVMEK